MTLFLERRYLYYCIASRVFGVSSSTTDSFRTQSLDGLPTHERALLCGGRDMRAIKNFMRSAGWCVVCAKSLFFGITLKDERLLMRLMGLEERSLTRVINRIDYDIIFTSTGQECLFVYFPKITPRDCNLRSHGLKFNGLIMTET